MKRPYRIPIILSIAATAFGANEFWNKTDASQWTGSEIKTLVTSSPWAKEIHLRSEGERGSLSTGDPGGTRQSSPAGGGGIGNPTEQDRIHQEQDGAMTPELVVRWDSAAPVRAACAKGGLETYLFSCYSKLMFLSGQSAKFEELAQSFYIVSLSNYPVTVLPQRDRAAPQHSSAATAALERLGQSLQEATKLKRKGMPALTPSKVLVLPAGKALLVVIFFPRSAALSLEDKDLVLESSHNGVEIKARFNLTKMFYKGRLEL